jgi:hypothetical protein
MTTTSAVNATSAFASQPNTLKAKLSHSERSSDNE